MSDALRLLVRLDVSKTIGTGHYARMKALQKTLDIPAVFAIVTDQPSSLFFDSDTVVLNDRESEFDQLWTLIKQHSVSAIAVDLLHFPKGYLAQLKARFKLPIIGVHDYLDTDSVEDLAVNYNFFSGWESAETGRFLAGPKYAFINPELLALKQVSKEDSLFVSFGGADPSGLMIGFLENVAPKLNLPIVAHIGPFFRYRDLLSTLSLSSNVQLLDSPKNLYASMAKYRYSLLAGGTMMYEAMYLENSVFVIAHNSHQAEFASHAEAAGGVRYLGLSHMISWETVATRLVQELTVFQPKVLIDGQGTARVAERIREVLA